MSRPGENRGLRAVFDEVMKNHFNQWSNTDSVDYAIRFSIDKGNLGAVKELLESTNDYPDWQQKVISADDNYLWKYASLCGYLNVIKLLVDREDNKDEKIRSYEDHLFRSALRSGYDNVLKYVIRSTDDEQRKRWLIGLIEESEAEEEVISNTVRNAKISSLQRNDNDLCIVS